jgi:ASC-1-like (ASCH) protein
MLSGRLSGAIKQQLNEDDFASTNQAAGTMIRQVGKDEEPIEMSKKENVDTFFKDLETWGKKMAGDKEQKEYRYIYLSHKEQPYGVASA